MKKLDLGSTVVMLANLGVIIGIGFLVIEIQQSNRIATAETEIEIRAQLSEVNEAFYAVPGMAALLVKALML